jgi:hypothetical protein
MAGTVVTLELEEEELSSWHRWVRRAKRVVGLLVAGLLDLAREVQTGDVVVIFGRDCYPAQEVLRVWAPYIRGTWIYVEGASRSVMGNSEFQERVARLVKKYLSRTGCIWGMDTGFAGSVPDCLLKNNSFLNCFKYRCRLLSAEKMVRRTFRRDNGKEGNEIRERALALEHYPKPFMRAVEVENGLPVLRLSCRKDILKAAAMMVAARELAEDLAEGLAFELGVGYCRKSDADSVLSSLDTRTDVEEEDSGEVPPPPPPPVKKEDSGKFPLLPPPLSKQFEVKEYGPQKSTWKPFVWI